MRGSLLLYYRQHVASRGLSATAEPLVDCVASRASVVLRVLHTTALKAHVGLWKQTKGRFPSCRTQCNGRNAGQKKPQRTQCMHTKNATHERIESIACVTLFACMRCVFRFFDWVANHASVALHLLRTTAWKPHVGLWVGLCDTVVYISLMSQWISSQTQCSSE